MVGYLIHLQEKTKRGGIFGLNKINLFYKNPIYSFPSEGWVFSGKTFVLKIWYLKITNILRHNGRNNFYKI